MITSRIFSSASLTHNLPCRLQSLFTFENCNKTIYSNKWIPSNTTMFGIELDISESKKLDWRECLQYKIAKVHPGKNHPSGELQQLVFSQ